MSKIRCRFLIFKTLIVFVWCGELTTISAAPFSNSRSDTKLNVQRQEWMNGWRGHPKWPRNTNTQNELPYMNIISGKSKEWTNFEDSRPQKRSDYTESDSLLEKTPLLGGDCSSNSSKHPCPINLLYGNNLTVKNFFLMIPEGNFSCKDRPQTGESLDMVKFTNPVPSLQPDLRVNQLAAFGGQNKTVMELLISNDTPHSSIVTDMTILETLNISINSSLTTEALPLNSDFNSTTYLGGPISTPQSYSSIQNSTSSENLSNTTLELNSTVNISNKSSEEVVSSNISLDGTSDNSTTPFMDTVNFVTMITLATDASASVNTSINNGTQDNSTVSPGQLVTSSSFDNTTGKSSSKDEFLRTVDKYCETLSFNLTNDNGTYTDNPVGFPFPRQVRLNEFTDRKYSMKRQMPHMGKSKRTLLIKNLEKNAKKES